MLFSTENAERLVRLVMRPRLRWSERVRGRALVAAYNTLRTEARKAKDRGFADSYVLLNAGLYLIVAERDVHAMKIDALTHPDNWTRQLAARVILLTIHELLLNKVTGNSLRNALKHLNASEELMDETNACLRALRKAQEKAAKQYAVIRNAAIAHRDADALRQCDLIEGLDVMKTLETASEFYRAAERFTSVLIRLLTETTSFTSLLGQWMRSQIERDA